MAKKIITQRRCVVCRQTKPITEFYKSKTQAGGHRYECKDCCKTLHQTETIKEYKRRNVKKYRETNPHYPEKNRQRARNWRRDHPDYVIAQRSKRSSEINLRNALLYKFKLSMEDYHQMVEQQQNRCAICGNPPPYQRLAIDHDHSCCAKAGSCGKCIRGLLCPHCNAGLGAFKDNETLMLKAIEYLKKYRAC